MPVAADVARRGLPTGRKGNPLGAGVASVTTWLLASSRAGIAHSARTFRSL
jgi:hypothetical protein